MHYKTDMFRNEIKNYIIIVYILYNWYYLVLTITITLSFQLRNMAN